MHKILPLAISLIFVFSKAVAQPIEVIKYPHLLLMIQDCEEKDIRIYNFWATWCKPCVEELPYLESLHSKYDNVQVSLISFDDVQYVKTKVKTFVEKHGLKAKVYLLDETDYNAFIDLVDPRWSGAIPATIIVDCKNRKKLFYEKPFKEGELDEVIEGLRE